MWRSVHRYRYHWLSLFFSLATLYFFTTVHPYHATGRELLRNSDFSQGFQAWKLNGAPDNVRIDKGLLTIDHGESKLKSELMQCWPGASLPDQLVLAAETMSRAVERGSEPWHEARIDLVDYDGQGEGIYGDTRLVGLQDDIDWQSFSQIFRRHPSSAERCVEIALYSASGQFNVRRLSLREAVKVDSYEWIRGLLFVGWVAFVSLILYHLYSHYKDRVQGRYLIFLLPLVVGGILMPNETREAIENLILSGWSSLGFEPAARSHLGNVGVWELWPRQWDLSKISHLLGFTLLSVVLLSEKRRDPGFLIYGLLLLALASESLQGFVPERTPRLSDLRVDSLGILLGWMLLLLARGKRQTA
jgi:hypothetical protein